VVLREEYTINQEPDCEIVSTSGAFIYIFLHLSTRHFTAKINAKTEKSEDGRVITNKGIMLS